jgi:ferric-dicitrate binding protein FerR (iron transport regulator)
MPDSVSGITPELVQALRNGDDAALERLFHERVESVRGRAARELENASSAARVTERVFIALWKERGSLQTPGDVEAALAELLKQHLVREKSRLAAVHRFEETEHVHLDPDRHANAPTEEVLWAHVSSAIHAPPPDPARTAHLMADHSRHAAAEHVDAIAKRSQWKGALALASIAVLAVVGLIWALDRAAVPAQVEKAFARDDVRRLTTNSGQRGAIDLRDGGKVQLGPRSTLQIPAQYGDELRVVKVEGAAHINAASAQQPVEVRLAVAPIAVTGKDFTVSAYPRTAVYYIGAGDAEARVRLEESTRTIAPGATLAITAEGGVRTPSDVEAEEALGWTDALFVVNDRPLRDALDAMRLAYGLDIGVSDPALLERRVSARAPLASSRDAIAALEESGKMTFGYAGEQMVMRDAAGKVAAQR